LVNLDFIISPRGGTTYVLLWERWSQSKFASHYIWGTNGVSECKINVIWVGFLHGIKWIMFHGHLDYFQKPPLGGRPNMKSETLAFRNLTIVHLLYFIMCENPTWIVIPWNKIWWRGRLHMIAHYTWGHVTTLHEFGIVLGQPLDSSFGLSQFHVHGSWLVCEVALNHDMQCQLLNWITFSHLRQFLVQSKYIHWTSYNFLFVQILHTLLY
jgi:hypothetical protein